MKLAGRPDRSPSVHRPRRPRADLHLRRDDGLHRGSQGGEADFLLS
ncbi:hypothetical protein LV779_33160 [Streptomyces thinghirensis]|nr:hypothetical protein [Streptomyces thinghirensis]